jgi:hypothetical protein
VGCSHEAATTEYNPQERHARVMLGVAPVEETTLDLLYYEASTAELTASCMRAQGFDYVAGRPEATISTVRDMNDRATVEQWGFNISTVDFSTISPTVDDPNEAVYGLLSPEDQQVWRDNQASCQQEAEEAFGRDSGLNEVNAKTQEIYARIERDSAILSGKDEWSACMQRQGFDALTEEALIAELRSEFAVTSPDDLNAFKAKEIRAALISYDCRQTLDRARREAIANAVQELAPTWRDAIRDEPA